MTEDHDAIARQVQVGFDGSSGGIEGGLEGGEGILRLKTAGAAVSLKVEEKRRHCWHVRARKNLAAHRGACREVIKERDRKSQGMRAYPSTQR
jgi:hypothetical protein